MSERERCRSVRSNGLIGLSAPMPLSETAEQYRDVTPLDMSSSHCSRLASLAQAAELVSSFTSAVLSVTVASAMLPLACMHSRITAAPVSKS